VEITKQIYDKKHQEFQDKLALLNIEIEENTKADFDYQMTVASVLNLARHAKRIFESSEISEKRQFINYLIQNPTVKEKTLVFNLRSPFDALLNFSKSPEWLPILDKLRTLNWSIINKDLNFSGILSLIKFDHVCII